MYTWHVFTPTCMATPQQGLTTSAAARAARLALSFVLGLLSLRSFALLFQQQSALCLLMPPPLPRFKIFPNKTMKVGWLFYE